MDRIVDSALELWKWTIAPVAVLVLLLLIARGGIGLLRLIPPLRAALARPAEWMASWYWRLHWSAFVLMGVAVLWPVLIVVAPVVGLTWLLLWWLVPDRAPGDDDASNATLPRPKLEWPLRLVTGTALAQLLATAALLWLVKVPATPVTVGAIDGQAVQIDRLVVWTVSAFLPVGIGLLLSGAGVHALARLVVAAAIGLASRPPLWHGPPAWAWFALMAGLVAVAIGPALGARTPAARSAGRFVTRALVIALMLGAFLAAMAIGLSTNGAGYPAYLDRLVSELAFLVVPVLFLAGVDFVGLGAALGRWSTRWTLRTDRRAPQAGAALFASAASVAVALWIGSIDATGLGSLLLLVLAGGAWLLLLTFVVAGLDGFGRAGEILGVLVIAAGGMGLIALAIATEWRLLTTAIAVAAVVLALPLIRPGGPGTWSVRGLTPAAIIVLAVAMAGTREIVVLVRAEYAIPPNARTTTFRVSHLDSPAGRVSLGVPAHWTETLLDGMAYFGEGTDPYASGAVIAAFLEPGHLSGTGVDALEPWVNRILPAEYPWATIDFVDRYQSQAGEWRLSRATLTRDSRRYLIDVFDHAASDGHWFLAFVRGERYEQYFSPIVAPIVGSLRFSDEAIAPDPVPPPDLRRRIASVGGFGFLPVLFAPVGYLLLFRKRSEGPAGTYRDHAALLAIVVTATAVFFLPDTNLIEFREGSQPSSNPLATLQLMLGAATVLLALLVAIGRPIPAVPVFLRELASTNVALLVMALVYAVYGALIPLGNRRVEIEVAIFLVALVWDLATSGREITSADGPIFPRSARVLGYMGYLVIVSSVLLFISTQTLEPSGAPVPKLVESEDVVRQGLVWLGAPVLLLRAALRWNEAVRRGRLED